jgi:predicted porin
MGNMTILGRIDIFNPIDLAEEDVEKFIIAGIGYSFSKNVQAMIDVRYNTSQNPEILDDTKVYLNWEIKY